MTILDRYIFKQVFLAVLVGMFMFVVIWISPEILFKIIRDTIYQTITFNTAIKLFFLEIPEILSKAIPVGLLIGSMFVFDRMSKDSELTIIRGSGVSISRLFLPVIVLSLIGAALCFFVFNNVIPFTSFTTKELRNDVAQSHFVYMDKSPEGNPENILIVSNYANGHLYGIKYLMFSDAVSNETTLIKSIITADFAEIKEDHWVLKQGIEYRVASDGVYENILPFNTMQILDEKTSKQAKDLLLYSTKKAGELTKTEIKDYMNILNACQMQDERKFIMSKYYQRAAFSIGCVLFGICGVLLGFSRPREKRFIGFTLGVGLIFIYYVILPFLDLLVQTGTISPIVSAWTPNLIVLTAIICLMKYKEL